jgi:hypothetical protein
MNSLLKSIDFAVHGHLVFFPVHPAFLTFEFENLSSILSTHFETETKDFTIAVLFGFGNDEIKPDSLG